MAAKEFLKEIMTVIELTDGELDDEGNPVVKPSYEKLEELVDQIYGLCEGGLSQK